MHTAALPATRTNGAPTRADAPDPVDVHVGERVKARRRQLSISQEKLAKCLGVTFQQLQKYECGHNRIGASRLFDIATALRSTPDFFYQGIGADILKGRPFKVDPEIASALEQKAANDPLANPEVLAIIDAFVRIKSDSARQHLIALVDHMAGG